MVWRIDVYVLLINSPHSECYEYVQAVYFFVYDTIHYNKTCYSNEVLEVFNLSVLNAESNLLFSFHNNEVRYKSNLK